MKKRVIHSDLIRKLDNTQPTEPAYLDSVKNIKDIGFRYLVGEVIQKDEARRKTFLESKVK